MSGFFEGTELNSVKGEKKNGQHIELTANCKGECSENG
jgi:hypothetical protein